MEEMALESPSPPSANAALQRSSTALVVIESGDQAIASTSAHNSGQTGSPVELISYLAGSSVRRVVVFVASSLTYPVSLSSSQARKLTDQRRLAYCSEEYLPFSAEEMTVGMRVGEEQALAIAVLTAQLQPWIKALEDAGIELVAICPLGLALAQQLAAPVDSKTRTCLLVEAEAEWEIVVTQQGLPRRWVTLRKDAANVDARFAIALGQFLPIERIVWGKRDEDIGATLKELTAELIERPQDEVLGALHEAGRTILAGRMRPWVDLRVGALAPRDPLRRWFAPIAAAMVGCSIAMVALGGVLLERSRSFEEIRSGFELKQAAVFTKLFPDHSIPVGIENRLRSEQLRLEKAHSLADDKGTEDSAFAVLHEALSLLPTGMRYRIVKVSIDGERLVLEGEARNHSDVELIAQKLSTHPRFKAALPRTRKGTDRSFVFTITIEVGTALAAKESSS
jgi:hypothetical protein